MNRLPEIEQADCWGASDPRNGIQARFDAIDYLMNMTVECIRGSVELHKRRAALDELSRLEKECNT